MSDKDFLAQLVHNLTNISQGVITKGGKIMIPLKDLWDVSPHDYSGLAGQVTLVNAGEDGIEFGGADDIEGFDGDAQDAVGGILTDTNTVDLTYNAGTSITADVIYQDTNTIDIGEDGSGLKADVLYQSSGTAEISDDGSGLKVNVITRPNGKVSGLGLGAGTNNSVFDAVGTLTLGAGVYMIQGVEYTAEAQDYVMTDLTINTVYTAIIGTEGTLSLTPYTYELATPTYSSPTSVIVGRVWVGPSKEPLYVHNHPLIGDSSPYEYTGVTQMGPTWHSALEVAVDADGTYDTDIFVTDGRFYVMGGDIHYARGIANSDMYSRLYTDGNGIIDWYSTTGWVWAPGILNTGLTFGYWADVNGASTAMNAVKWYTLFIYTTPAITVNDARAGGLTNRYLHFSRPVTEHDTEAEALLENIFIPTPIDGIALPLAKVTMRGDATGFSSGTVTLTNIGSSYIVRTGVISGTTDHGALTGLSDDDHSQYTKKATLTTKGDVYYASATSTPTRLGVGTANTLLRVSTDVPAWTTGVFSDGTELNIKGDSKSVFFGEGDDTKIYYDGTDMNIDTDLVAPSDLVIDCGTDKTIELEETVWKDINMGSAMLSKPASSAPDTDEFKDSGGSDTGVETYAFAVGEKVSGGFEIQHDYKEGSDFTFHIHWQGITAPTGTDYVNWQLIYTISRDGEVLQSATTITSETGIATQYDVLRTDFTTITGSTAGHGGGNVHIGDQFLFQLSRIAAVTGGPPADEYSGDALLCTAGVHYQIDTIGSRQISTK